MFHDRYGAQTETNDAAPALQGGGSVFARSIEVGGRKRCILTAEQGVVERLHRTSTVLQVLVLSYLRPALKRTSYEHRPILSTAWSALAEAVTMVYSARA